MNFLIMIFATGLIGCQTVPVDAPKEILSAKKALYDMRESEGDKIMPHTAAYAEKKFDQSLELYKDSIGKDSLVSRDDAIREANVATQYATAVIDIGKKMNEWDKNRAHFQEAFAFLDMQDTGLLMAKSSEPESPLAKLSGTEFIATVGFFDPGSALDPIIAVEELESIMDILNRDKSITLTLIGSTDPNLASEENKGLGMERALTIANQFKEFGIESKRIALKTMPMNSKLFANGDVSTPWNRRVVARITLFQ